MRTSRNMAWYPPEYVERIRLIKRLQEERFLPLAADQGRARAVERGPHRAAAARRRAPRCRRTCPHNVLDRLAELGVLTPDADGYDPDDVQ